jgi:carbonic anhydrase
VPTSLPNPRNRPRGGLSLAFEPRLGLGFLLALALVGCGGTVRPTAKADAEWRYSGDRAPTHWADLEPAYSLCGNGQAQSPVNVVGAQHAPVSALTMAYRPAPFRVRDTGHTFEAIPAGLAGGIVLGLNHYRLAEFHFHAPSEHRIAGRRFKMELQLVHRSSRGRVAVIAVMIREGISNRTLAGVFSHVPKPGEPVETEVNPSALLPPERSSYRYKGSLTTPPCTEGVSWIVYREPIELSRDDILAFTHRYDGVNRPLQPLNGRMIAAAP